MNLELEISNYDALQRAGKHLIFLSNTLFELETLGLKRDEADLIIYLCCTQHLNPAKATKIKTLMGTCWYEFPFIEIMEDLGFEYDKLLRLIHRLEYKGLLITNTIGVMETIYRLDLPTPSAINCRYKK